MELGKIPPHDVEAEQAVLGSMLTDKEAIVSAIEVLRPEDFYRDDNKTIFKAISNIYAKGGAVDIITVKDELTTMAKLEAIGGLQYLAELPEKVPTTANVEKYIKIVEEKSLLRSLIKDANNLLDLGYSQTEDSTNIIESAQSKMFDMLQRKSQKGYEEISKILSNSLEEISKLSANDAKIRGTSTGYPDLDELLSGLKKTELILLAARPAMGKSAFALNIATNVAIRARVPVVIFSLEMSKEQCAHRILCSQAMVDSRDFENGNLQDKDWQKIAVASGEIAESAGIFIDDTPGITVGEIRAKCRKLKLEKNIGLIVIDYLQLIQGNTRTNSREQEIAEISRSLKIIAKEVDVPIIALSQLSRALEARENHRPMLQDLRESGSIEQDADIVMFIYREDYYRKDEAPPTNIAEIIVAKNRSGPLGKRELLWMPKYTKFASMEKRYG